MIVYILMHDTYIVTEVSKDNTKPIGIDLFCVLLLINLIFE